MHYDNRDVAEQVAAEVRELRKLHRQDAGYMEPVPVRDFSRRIVRLKSVSKRGT